MECKQLCELLLDDLLVSEDCAHVSSECIHVLAHGDLVHLSLILECIKLGSEVLDLVLLGRRRTGHIRLRGSGEEGGGGVGGRGNGWWMVGQPHPGSPHYQTKFGMLSTLPHPKVHDPSHKPPRIGERLAYPS